MKKRKFIIPVDFSEQSAKAVAYASIFLTHIPVEIHLVNVLESQVGALVDMNGNIIDGNFIPSVAEVEEYRFRERKIRSFARRLNVPAYTHVIRGELRSAIQNFVDQNGADALISGTHNISGFSEFLYSTQTASLARKVNIPVLAVKDLPAQQQIKHILLLNDFENPAIEDLNLIKDIQRAFGAIIHLFHVRKDSNSTSKSDILANMKQFAEINDLKDCINHVMLAKNLELGVDKILAKLPIDLIAIGTHQYQGFDYLFKGCESEKFINHSDLPIISFKLNNSKKLLHERELSKSDTIIDK